MAKSIRPVLRMAGLPSVLYPIVTIRKFACELDDYPFIILLHTMIYAALLALNAPSWVLKKPIIDHCSNRDTWSLVGAAAPYP